MNKAPPSLHRRLLATVAVVLVVFIVLIATVLDRAHRNSVERSIQQSLQAQIYAMLAAAEYRDSGTGLFQMQGLAEPRFAAPGSGLYGAILDSAGEVVWLSPSALGVDFPPGGAPIPHTSRFAFVQSADESEFISLYYGVEWEIEPGRLASFTFVAAEDDELFESQAGAFRKSLWLWLVAVAVLLLLLQWWIVNWGLKPIRDLAHRVTVLEKGEADTLEGSFPRELRPLVDNLNAFIRNEREHLKRNRNTLDDLAHSLKTPLAVLGGMLEDGRREFDWPAAREQVDRMHATISHQLARAQAAGRQTLKPAVPVAPELDKVIAAVQKVYRDKEVSISREADDAVRFFGERGDLLEICGNLVENAFKWCRGRVVARAVAVDNPGGRRSGFELTVEDDGPGIDEDKRNSVLLRGVRADEQGLTEGQGIGLAMVHDIVTSYGGRLDIDRSDLGGARLRVTMMPD